MNAVEIEAGLTELALRPFDGEQFPYSFLAAFGNRETTLSRLRKGGTNTSDVPGGVLQRNNIHLAVSAPGEVGATLRALLASPKTLNAKAKFVLATDGITLEAADLTGGDDDRIDCQYSKFPDHFGFFLPLAGISTIKEIKDNPIDVRATGRLNKLYVELLRENPDWATAERRADMNHFMARLIFCFFAEDTDIFHGESVFTRTVDRMSERDASNTHDVLSELFRAMNVEEGARDAAGVPRWAQVLPYVNGGLFSGGTDAPRFTRAARSYLFQAGQLNWKEINPDIFGSMIQAVADDEERDALGMHYTSVPNILKVLNPLFLDDLRTQLDAAGENRTKLLNLRKRMARIRVFDPACGSGNFLVIAYKQMRQIEADVNRRRGESEHPSEIPLTNFRGIELRDFPAEIARLALIIAEFQCDVIHRGQIEALKDVVPLDSQNWITCGNALRLDWLAIWDAEGTGVKLLGDDLFNTPRNQSELDFANEGGETYICGNPPYAGKGKKSASQLADMEHVFGPHGLKHGYIDYVACWFAKAAEYGLRTNADCAFVSTNSLCQGHQAPILWPLLFGMGHEIAFAYTSFKWANLATHNAGVTVVVIGLSRKSRPARKIFSVSDEGESLVKEVTFINAYLTGGANVLVEKQASPISELSPMDLGNMPYDGENLLLSAAQVDGLNLSGEQRRRLVRRIYGSKEFINGLLRYCLWIENEHLQEAMEIPEIRRRIEAVRTMRLHSTDAGGRAMAARAHQLREMRIARSHAIVMPRTSSESRPYLPAGLIDADTSVSSEAFSVLDAPLWQLAVLMSKLHLSWIATVCGKLKTDFRYSNVLGWNTFPVPLFTEQNKIDLTRCAEDILVVRESHFPATIADLYGAEAIPEDLRRAHERNDEVLERIYLGRRFRNDTERMEKLFELYTKMTAAKASKPVRARKLR
jgi:hypothetical protein